MADRFDLNSTNFTCNSTPAHIESERWNVQLEVNFVVTLAINSVTCPLTVLLNVLVIMAVKRRRSLQSYANVLLAYLAATDVFTGIIGQPSFILWMTLRLLDVSEESVASKVKLVQTLSMHVVLICSSLHLALVTGERLVAIKFTMDYPLIVRQRNIKMAVISIWTFSTFVASVRLFKREWMPKPYILAIPLLCLVFAATAHVILYTETLRHRKIMQTQQIPQQEMERLVKERKALKTTLMVMCAVMFCFLPPFIVLFWELSGINTDSMELDVSTVWTRTFCMLNSFINPFIYCFRQKEMRTFVFRIKSLAIDPAN